LTCNTVSLSRAARLAGVRTRRRSRRCRPPPDLSHLATKDELRAEIASVRADLKIEAGHLRTDIAQTAQRQTTWLVTVVIAAAGIVIAAQRLIPPALPTDAVRAIVEQTMRNLQPQPQPAPGPAAPPRAVLQP
jgi:hypothetical protein